jgi:hypothetical protein
MQYSVLLYIEVIRISICPVDGIYFDQSTDSRDEPTNLITFNLTNIFLYLIFKYTIVQCRSYIGQVIQIMFGLIRFIWHENHRLSLNRFEKKHWWNNK